jgi:TusA-related sulfurtransferase
MDDLKPAMQPVPVRPTDGEMIEVLATHFEVSEDTIVEWIKGMDL